MQGRTVVTVVVATVLFFVLNYMDSVSSIVAFARDGVRFKLQRAPSNTTSSCPAQRQNPSSCLALRGTSGKWVQDWDYAKRSYYNISNAISHYVPTSEAPFRWETSWVWQTNDDCKVDIMNRLELCRVCHDLNMTRIYIGGDSLNELFYESLLGLVGIPLPRPRKHHQHDCAIPIPCAEYNCPDLQVMFGRFDKDPYRSLRSGQNDENSTAFVRNNTDGGTLLVLNTGAHFGALGLDYFHKTISTFFRWIRDLARPGKDLVFIRNTVPGHPQCTPRTVPTPQDLERGFQTRPLSNYSEWQQYFETEMNNLTRNWVPNQHGWQHFEYFNEYMHNVMERDFWGRNCSNNTPNVLWLNVLNMTVLRIDGHIGYNGWFPDCLHYWAPGPIDFWVHLWFSNLKDLASDGS